MPDGLALCKIHHVAYDRNIIGVRPDLVVQVREDVLAEEDGPMLKHGIQEMHGGKLRVVPRVKAARPESCWFRRAQPALPYAEFVAYEPGVSSNLST